MIRDSKATIEGLLNATQDSAILVDREGTLLAMNREAARRRGVRAEDLLGKSLYEYMAPEALEIRRSNIQLVKETGNPAFAEEAFGGRYYHVSCYPILDDRGEVVQIATFSRDRTESKLYEMEILEAKEAAEAANMAKAQILANMSHELRTPLHAILGLAQMSMVGDHGQELLEIFSMIYDSGFRLLNTLNNLLDLAALEQGNIETASKAFSVASLVSSIRRANSLKASVRETNLRVSVDRSLPLMFRGDEYRLRRILSHLVANAIQSTSGGWISIDSRRLNPGEEQEGMMDVLFCIEDNGIGIEEKWLPTIFDSFTIAENVLTKRRSGAGIGLNIVKTLVDSMGGTIEVHSSPGKGTRIVFSVPLEVVNEVVVEPYPEPEEWYCDKDEDTRCRVMVVEDEPSSMLVVGKVLRDMGVRVLTANNGSEALNRLCSNPVDLILMDLEMPVMDGLQAVRLLRDGAVPGLSQDVPIVAMSVHLSPYDREQILDKGFDEALCKPYTLDELRAVVQQFLDRPRPGRDECPVCAAFDEKDVNAGFVVAEAPGLGRVGSKPSEQGAEIPRTD